VRAKRCVQECPQKQKYLQTENDKRKEMINCGAFIPCRSTALTGTWEVHIHLSALWQAWDEMGVVLKLGDA